MVEESTMGPADHLKAAINAKQEGFVKGATGSTVRGQKKGAGASR